MGSGLGSGSGDRVRARDRVSLAEASGDLLSKVQRRVGLEWHGRWVEADVVEDTWLGVGVG